MNSPVTDIDVASHPAAACEGDDAPPAGVSMEVRRRWFEERYGDWIAEQNAEFETYGIWNEANRPW